MKPLVALLTVGLLWPVAADAFTVSGRFLYEDRLYDGNGYTGAVQNLPIRRGRIEVVNTANQAVLASGTTGDDGRYSVAVNGQTLPVNVRVRCITDGRPAGYQMRVVDTFVRDFANGTVITTGSTLYSISTDIVLAHNPALDLDFGDFLIQDTDGMGVAQAFNIFDNAVDFFDWMAQPGLRGSLPAAADFLVLGWSPTGANQGSNYSVHGVFIGASPTTDTDGWSDTVILHEIGHWFDDFFSRSDNPGGPHFIGDNNANVLLAYGEGAATYHCAKVRERRALTRLNLSGQPVDNLVSLYADLSIPPAVGTPGALEFSYDFETGNFADDGTPIGQRGSANETNVTSVLWDLLDGPGTPDATPGVDDDALEVSDAVAWQIENSYLPSLPPSNPITIEDYYQGWFAVNGAGFEQAKMDFIFVNLAQMPFIADVFEVDDTIANAGVITPMAHAVAAGRVVINELDLGPQDAVELYNATANPVDLTGWQIEVYVNGVTNDPSRIYTFPAFVLDPGEVVAVHERGDPTLNGRYHLYAGDAAGLFNMSWANGGDGAAVLRNASNVPVDFVKWSAANGTPNSTPVPAGLSFSGVVTGPPAPQTLARDISGTDTDVAADFSAHYGSLGSANHPSPQAHTIFGTGDRDVVAFAATAGTRYSFEARGPYSASDPRLELLDAGGNVMGSNSNMDPSVRDARLDFYASSSGTFYLRVRHEGARTDWAEYDLLAFARPVAAVFLPPSGLTATASNATDTSDPVNLAWSNAGAYDEVVVYRNGTEVARLTGPQGSYTDHADRGLYRWEVAGVLNGQETARTGDFEFAGRILCFAQDDFESGNAGQWIRDGSNWDVTPLAADGTWGFTDSPTGLYEGCPGLDSSCKNNAIAVFGVPSALPAHGGVLDFDHICITEADFDYGIVEISDNDGASWTELARFDQTADPAWEDNVAGPDDWRHVQLPLTGYGGKQVLIRFRLESDQLLELDGWYVDNVAINDPTCNQPVPALVRLFDAEGEAGGVRLRLELSEEVPGGRVVVYRGTSSDAASRAPLTPEPLALAGTTFEYLDATLPAGETGWYWTEVWDANGLSLVNGPVQAQAGGEIRVTFASPAWPNPARGAAVFQYAIGTDQALGGSTQVHLTLHDLRGRLVRTLVRGEAKPGNYRVEWNRTNDGGARVAPGVYFARFRAGSFFHTSNVVVLD